MTRILGSLILLLTLTAAAPAQVTLTVDANDGDVITGVRVFRATVKSKDLVNQVEFYVNDDLRDTDSSTPYEFSLDTLAEKEGDITVTFAAYTTEGTSAKKTLKLKIDNGMGQGVQHFVDKGNEALTARKWDEAIQQGRIALKIQADSNPARMVMAKAHYGKGVFDQAQKYAEDIVASDAANFEALDLLSAINLSRGFNNFNRGGDRAQTLDVLRSAISAAAKNRAQVFELRLNQIGAATDGNRLELADVANRAGRYSLAIDATQSAWRKDELNAGLANRLIYAQLRAGRFSAATQNALNYQKRGRPDAYGKALIALLLHRAGEEQKSNDMMAEAVLDDSQNLGVRLAQAHLALEQTRRAEFGRMVDSLAADEPQSPEVMVYRTIAYELGNQYDSARSEFERGVKAEPALYDLYVQRGNQAVVFSQQPGLDTKEVEYQRQVARVFYESALIAKPESFEAYTALTILNMLENKREDALRSGRNATLAGPEYAAAHYANSMVLSLQAKALQDAKIKLEDERDRARDNNLTDEVKRLTEEALKARDAANKAERELTAALAAASKLDPRNLLGATVPDPKRAFEYFSRFGKLPILTQPK